MNTICLYLPTISMIVMLIAACLAICFYFKNKDEQEFYVSLENVLSKLGDNETDKVAIISRIAYALKNAKNANIKHKNTEIIRKVIQNITEDQYELASRKALVSGKLFSLLILLVVVCITNLLVSFGYSSLPSFGLFGITINLEYRAALAAFNTAVTLLVITILWTALKIGFKNVCSWIKNKFKSS